MMTNNIEVFAMLKRANAFLPYRPVFCLKELKDLKNLGFLKLDNEKAESFFIKGKAYLEMDDLEKALVCFQKGMKLEHESEVLSLKFKLYESYVNCILKKDLEENKDEILSLILNFRSLEEDELYTEARLFYGIALFKNGENSEALTFLKDCYEHSILNKYPFIEIKSISTILDIHFSMGNLNSEEVSEWMEKEIIKNDELDLSKGKIKSLLHKAKIDSNLGHHKEARSSYEKVLQIFGESGVHYKSLMIETLSNLAHSYLIPGMEDPVKSYEISSKAMEMIGEKEIHINLPHLLLGLTKVLLLKKESDIPFSPLLDKEWMEDKLNIAEEHLDKNDLKSSKFLWQAYANYYRYKGDLNKSLYYMDKLVASNEALLIKEKTETINLLQEENESQRKELELKEKELEKKEVLEELNNLLEKTVSHRTQDLKLKNQELKDYAYIVAHDLKEPIRTIVGFINILEKRMKSYAKPEDLELFDFIKNSGNRMNDLVEGLLKYSTIKMTEDDLSLTDLNKTVRLILADIDRSIKKSNATIELSKLPDMILVNRIMIKQVFQNLISNAIKFKEKGKDSIVKINCETRKDDYLFTISDNGIGIGKSYHKIIFKLFNRIHKAKDYKGTGIGLSVCKKIVELHGGEIWLESEEGVGTTFFFTLPK